MQSTLGQVQSASTPTKTAATTATTITQHSNQKLKLKGKKSGEKKAIVYYSKPKKV